ncbi:TonB-dependent receptor [Roseibacterium beibuensis]|uniref:TonB-dependent receptor domain-containing protein n=1 Tax=[Roseibacterium] beibuensis TaxID=1193142 RepID=UPI00217CECC4|nr:TonB-dependent receptor [Roseibacterium beibuensis]MCS6625419.1 TonB-dependent receptor [Roseibacterium beibuensis]
MTTQKKNLLRTSMLAGLVTVTATTTALAEQPQQPGPRFQIHAGLNGGSIADQDAPPRPEQDENTTDESSQEIPNELSDIVVTGSRIPRNEFTSPSPIQVLTSERAEQRGLSDTAQLLQSSTLAAGSPQVNSAISSAFVTDGGPGASTISLRGLGANRTLVLLNGRRAGPAGTRGGVSAFDLNVIPQSAINRIDILKDGASSVYGSDAVAGVVNLITERARDGGEMAAFASLPFEQGGEQYNLSGSFGKTFDRGYINFSGDYYRQEELTAGDRDYLNCRQQYVFEPGTNNRADRIDPRTGEPTCNDLVWGQVYVYGPDFSGRAGRFQFDYDGDLGNYIPTNSGAPGYPTAPAGFYLVNYDPASRAVVNASHPFAQEESVIPETERYTAFVEGAYELGSGVEAYAELLLNRRESRTNSYRQFWNYTYTNDFLDFYYGPGAGGDPLTGFSGLNILSATAITDHFDQSQTVDYTRLVLGLRGDIGGGFLDGWNWDVFVQRSRSDGDYTSDVILDDAVASTNFKTSSCVGTNLPVSGRPCIDVDFTDPRFLAGDLTQEERDFLFDTETGNTIYEQTYIEGSIAGNLFELPAGPLGAALGFHVRKDEIVDTPGEITLADNSWNLTGAGITEGDEETKEVYAELAVPLLVDMPYVQSLDLSLSGRYTDTKTSGGASTYKAGLNWALSDSIRIRATHGTSFRAPALFELYLADQSGFVGQRNVDPCLNLDIRLADGSVSQELYSNCTNPAGPGGGVSGTFVGGNSSTEIVIGGGLGDLVPETSVATVVGVVLTPPDSNLSLAIDYFEIKIEDEVARLGAGGILAACYLSDNFPSDPICNQFDRHPTLGITQVRDSFVNIAEQNNRGLDFTARWFHDFSWGTLTLDSQTTWTLETNQSLFVDAPSDFLGDVGNPELVGNINASVSRGPWTAFWGFDWIGNQDDMPDFVRANGTQFQTIDGRQTQIKAEAEFTGFHSVSLSYESDGAGWSDGWTVSGGVANLFDEKPPAASAIAVSTLGNSVFSSQYTEAYYGRRAFLRLSKSF